MEYAPHLDSLDLDVAPEEELPGYEPQTAPTYDSGDYETPTHVYRLQQVARRLQLWVPYAPISTSSIKILSRGPLRVFSKKADMEMLRVSHGADSEDRIASIAFNNDCQLPWRPRAQFSHCDSNSTTTYAMESKNFTDWKVTIGRTTFTWRLEGKPVSLVLSEETASLIIARFTYSGCGTTASKGAEVGELTIYRDGLSADMGGIEKIMASLMVCIVHFKKMGRQYWNDAPVRATSLSREPQPSYRAPSASHSIW